MESLAQVGVQLLLFTLGLEFSLQKLKAVRSVALIGLCLLPHPLSHNAHSTWVQSSCRLRLYRLLSCCDSVAALRPGSAYLKARFVGMRSVSGHLCQCFCISTVQNVSTGAAGGQFMQMSSAAQRALSARQCQGLTHEDNAMLSSCHPTAEAEPLMANFYPILSHHPCIRSRWHGGDLPLHSGGWPISQLHWCIGS